MTNPYEAGMEVLDGISPLIEIISGFKAKVISEGFSVESAEAMSVELFKMSMRQISPNGN